MQRVIMHIDFNSYFATVEQQDHPEWRGRPLGVCEHLGGIIIAASVEAKKWGIKTGTPVWEAKKLCPRVILTKTTPGRYRYYTQKFLNLLAEFAEHVEAYSIDEAFLDVSDVCNVKSKIKNQNVKLKSPPEGADSYIWEYADPFEEARLIALEIKRRLKTEVGDYLRVSVGVGWNKLVAKIGSDLQKPDGLTILRPEDKARLYNRLALTDIPGIGNRQAQNLAELGIRKLTDLRDFSVAKLRSRFGIMGYHLFCMGQLEGSWHEEFGREDSIKSIGHVYAIPRQFRKPGVGESVLYRLSEMVGRRLREQNLWGNVVSVYFRDAADYAFGQRKKLGRSISDGRDIFLESRHILSKVSFGTRDIRQIGVTVSGLKPFVRQQSLFAIDNKHYGAVAALDAINAKYEGPMASLPRTKSALGDAHKGTSNGWVIARVPAWQARDVFFDSIGFGRLREWVQ